MPRARAQSTAIAAAAAVGASLLASSSAASRPARTAVMPAAARAAAVPIAPATVKAQRITRGPGTAKVGTAVPTSGLGQRVFVNGHDGFTLGSVGEAQYPAASTDGGATWKTTGPALHVNAAQAPLSVTEVGAAGRRTYYYFGSSASVDATGDGGKHWWRAFLGAVVLAVVPGPNRLIAIAQQPVSNSTTKALTWVYVSRDGGKVWRYDSSLGAS